MTHEEFDDLLCSRYPALFRDRHGDKRETALCWGLMCGPGWFDLLDCLSAEITRHADETGLDVVATQVKEKFGVLRFYQRGGDEYVGGLISMASRMSKHTCEECGKPGWMSDSDWMKVRCVEHGGSPLAPARVPSHASYVVGRKGIRAANDNDVIIAGEPRPEPVFRLPEIRTERWKPLAAELEQALDLDIRRNGMPMVVIEDVIETETLSFRWHGGDAEGRARGLFRFVELFSARV